jgi:hypothetical protein
VLIYWHVERGSVVVHSQHLTCSASEVHAMVEGATRHGTSMSVEANYTDSHGQSEIGFGRNPDRSYQRERHHERHEGASQRRDWQRAIRAHGVVAHRTAGQPPARDRHVSP